MPLVLDPAHVSELSFRLAFSRTPALSLPKAPSPTGWAPRYLALGAKHPQSVMKLVFQMRPSGPPGQHPALPATPHTQQRHLWEGGGSAAMKEGAEEARRE